MLAVQHRVTHTNVGDPCQICGLPELCHPQPVKVHVKKRTKPAFRWESDKRVYLGIDGEGQGKKFHKYIFLACADTTGDFRRSIENKSGLPTQDCLDFILDLPTNGAKLFAYSFGYDLTKILTEVDNDILYRLFRPELRQRTGVDAIKGPYPETWRGYKLNYQGAKFTVSCGKARTVIWDVFKFFQGKFVNALKDWKVGDKELIERMTLMKDQRADFDKLDFNAVKEYCFEECVCMAQLAEKLTDAHAKAGLKLKSYYGAGSSAAAMLDVMQIRDKLKSTQPKEMEHAISSAFFGGRFENSVIGKVTEKVYIYDISSAYPYQLYFLPCLQHGKWKLSRLRRELETPNVVAAIVHYELDSGKIRNGNDGSLDSWGPFPFREKGGTICFPSQSGGGWVYRDEYLVGERLFPNVKFREAWIYECNCNCRPFAKIPEYYLERLRIGKEGPGIVIKLGCNSCYGKLAQSVGNAMYNSWLWAGMITSGTRAQLLELIGMHDDRRNALMCATDGLATRERIQTPKPLDTGTYEAWDSKDKKFKPLGGWEEKDIDKGMFFARPGIYFPINPTQAEIKDVRGRGVGKGVVLENWKRLVDAWPVKDLSETVAVTNVSRFCGAKSSISQAGKPGAYRYNRANGKGSAPRYGQWIVRQVDMSFTPMPKRSGVADDGMSLLVRQLPTWEESEPYDRVSVPEETELLRGAEEELWEQPDGDLSDYT